TILEEQAAPLPNSGVSEADRWMSVQAARYTATTGEPYPNWDMPETLAAPARLAERLAVLVQDDKPMLRPDERVLRSQLHALYCLIVSDGLTVLYEKHLARLSGTTPLTPEAERTLKAELAMKFLRQNAYKNDEAPYRGDVYAPTFGDEQEYW